MLSKKWLKLSQVQKENHSIEEGRYALFVPTFLQLRISVFKYGINGMLNTIMNIVLIIEALE